MTASLMVLIIVLDQFDSNGLFSKSAVNDLLQCCGFSQLRLWFPDIPDSSSNDEDDVKENRAWLREMLKYYTSNISQVYYAIGTYPYERSHITNPNAALRKAIAWQNGGSSS
jgi:hypothetical protein